jgi:hypothetical protein
MPFGARNITPERAFCAPRHVQARLVAADTNGMTMTPSGTALPVEYRLPPWRAWSFLGGLGFITAIGTLVTGTGAPIWFAGLWLVGVAVMWWQALVFVSFQVTVWPDSGRVAFRSVLRSKETVIGAITSIKPTFGVNPVLVTFRYRGGTACVPRLLDGWYDLIHRVQESNPGTAITGV